MKTDIEIAQEAELLHIRDIAEKVGLSEDDIEYYGKNKAKVSLDVMKRGGKEGKLVLVTAITPTPAGEGKTTTTIGLADGRDRLFRLSRRHREGDEGGRNIDMFEGAAHGILSADRRDA